jgi:hypothetical protein
MWVRTFATRPVMLRTLVSAGACGDGIFLSTQHAKGGSRSGRPPQASVRLA